jgi:hypothetical protein
MYQHAQSSASDSPMTHEVPAPSLSGTGVIMDKGLNFADKENGMNGWQRLWVFVSFVLGVATVVLGYRTMETESELTRWYKADLTARQIAFEETKSKEPVFNNFEITNPAMEDLIKNINKRFKKDIAEIEGAIKRVSELYRQDLEQLPEKQLKHVLTYAGAWLVICIVIYIIGSMLGWVYRGFRPKKA